MNLKPTSGYQQTFTDSYLQVMRNYYHNEYSVLGFNYKGRNLGFDGFLIEDRMLF